MLGPKLLVIKDFFNVSIFYLELFVYKDSLSQLLFCDVEFIFYSKWPIHTKTLSTDCYHCVLCTLYWDLCSFR